MDTYVSEYGHGTYGSGFYGFDGYRLNDTGAGIISQSGFAANIVGVFSTSAMVEILAIMSGGVIKKWEDTAPQAEDWTLQSATLEDWTLQSATSEDWG